MKKLSPLALIGLLTFLITTLSLRAPAADVFVSYFGLSPDPVNIRTGGVVYWDDGDDFGPYIVSGPWGSYYTPYGIRFLMPGTYQYTAESVLGGGSWGGTVNVTLDSLPTVNITNPTNNSVLIAPATFAFEADAYDADPNDIWDVEFWVGTNMVDDVFSAPYATTVTNLDAGTYTLTCVVWDYSYATATNSITITVANPGPIILSGATFAAGNLVFHANGLTAGKTNVLQCSSNLVNWLPIRTNVSNGSSLDVTNSVSSRWQFYRLMQIN